MPDHNYFSNLIWQIADLLRGPYRPPQYERVMLPLTVLRRFDCVLAPTKPAVVKRYEQVRDRYKGEALDRVLDKVAGQRFHNHSPLDFAKLKGDPDHVEKHLLSYIQGFSANVRRIFDYFELETEIEKMREANILFLVVSKFAEVDLHPTSVPNEQMGLIFENLIRRFNELANETAGDHFTPREVIRLMVSILFIHDDKLLATPGTVRKLLDPACGTGGMLAEAQNYLREHHAAARLYVYGQDYNKRAFATAAADMLMKQVDHNGGGENVKYGDSFTDDQFAGQRYDYFLTNPPFGVDWKKQQKEIQREHDKSGFDGRFGAGLPRVNDGALLFLQHMIHKFEPVRPAEQKHGSRLAIVFSGSPLFTGGAGSGESEIRRWIIENDWLEAIIALPEQMFYNTGIGTYVWIVTNRKEKRRKGKIQLIDARGIWSAGGSADNKRSLGDKRRHMTAQQIEEIVRLYGRFEESAVSKIFRNAEFGYTRITVERPLRLLFQITPERSAAFLAEYPDLRADVAALTKSLGAAPHSDWNTVSARIEDILKKRKASWKVPARKTFRAIFSQTSAEAEPVVAATGDGFEPDPDLRFSESVPLEASADEYFEREVRTYVRDAWMDRSKDRVGFEIGFSRHFDRYRGPRPLEVIDVDLSQSQLETTALLSDLTERTRRVPSPRSVRTPPRRDESRSWLGSLPSHWAAVPLRFLVSFVGGATPNTGRTEFWGGPIPWVSPKDMKREELADAEDHVSELAVASTSLRLIEPEAVLVVVRGMILAHSFPVAVTTRPLTINQDMKALICGPRLIPRFLAEYLRAIEPGLVSLAEESAHGTRKMETETLGGVVISLPPADEQRAIVELIQRERETHGVLIASVNRTARLLTERSSALIAAAVTGQFEAAGNGN